MTTATFDFNSYSIVISLEERSIYLKFTDQINFTNFEANLNAKELGLNFELQEIYKLICDTFLKEKDYFVIIIIENGFMKLLFHLLVSGFLKVKFQALLKEKILTNDQQEPSLNFNTLEQKYNTLLTKMNEMEVKMMRQNEEILTLVEVVSHIEVCLFYRNNRNNGFPIITVPINSKEITINNSVDIVNFEKIALFYALEKLTIESPKFNNLTNIKNNNLKELFIYSNPGNRCELQNLEGINNFPKLEKITLKTLMCLCLSSVTKNLSSINHNINHLVIINLNCALVNASELQNYCQINNIKLEIH